MLTVDQYEHIRIGRRVYGKSIKKLQRETGHSKNTIRKVLRGEYQGYSERKNQPYPVLGAYLDIIDTWLKGDKESPKKQRHTAKRIYDRLVEEHDFPGKQSNVRRYVRDAKIRIGVNAPKVFIPSDPELAREAEADWGTVTAIIAGEPMTLKFFCMRSKYSGKHFVRCYPCERQQAFFDAHMHAFAFFGGIFKTIIYDNLTTAIQKVLKGKGRTEQDSFSKFRAYYNFTPRFCNVSSPHEKGGVEGIVGYVRRNYMVPVPQAESLEELNRKLLEKCRLYGNHVIHGREHTVNEFFEHEKERLLALPHVPFENIALTQAKIGRYSTVIADENHYSAPNKYAGLKVRVILSVTTVDIFYNGQKVATHNRLYGKNKWQLDPDHYLELIKKRPESFDTARPIQGWRKSWPPSLEKLLDKLTASHGRTKGIKDFISILELYCKHDVSDVEAAVELALEYHVSSAEGVKHILLHSVADAVPASLGGWPEAPIPDVSIYSQLGGI